MGISNIAVGFTLPSETCHPFLCSCSETHVLPKQHGRSFEHKVPSCSLETKRVRRKVFPQFIPKIFAFLKRHSSLLETNLCSCLLEEELVTFAPSERWRLLTSPYSFKTFSLGVPEDDFDYSGDGGPLLTYMKQTSLDASSFFLLPNSPGSSMKIFSMISERLEFVAVVNHATFWIWLKVTWNRSPC